jgi:acyl dehydratase
MLDYPALKSWTLAPVQQRFTERDTILYALAIGCGGQGADPTDLRFVYEDGLVAFPTMAMVLAYPGFWLRNVHAGFDWRHLLHGEESMHLCAPLPATGAVTGTTRIAEVYDKGAGRDAILVTERALTEAATGTRLATVRSTILLRGAGGFGGPTGPPGQAAGCPGGPAQHVVDIPTSAQAALIYRLSGDTNPLHVDPAVATRAGFPRPILHGLCTIGVAARAVVSACFGGDPRALRRFGARCSAPFFPGETLRVEIWSENGGGQFRCTARERAVTVLTNGHFSRPDPA